MGETPPGETSPLTIFAIHADPYPTTAHIIGKRKETVPKPFPTTFR